MKVTAVGKLETNMLAISVSAASLLVAVVPIAVDRIFTSYI